MKQYTYLLIDLGCIIIPLIASFYSKHSFFKEWKYFFPANILVGSLFLTWDYYFTEIGVWGFNPNYLTGLYFFNLPLEEVLFFICIPYACTFTYFALKHLLKAPIPASIHRWISALLIVVSIQVSYTFYPNWYTCSTFILLGIWIVVTLFLSVNQTLPYLAYLLILPFFFMSNGILTGSLLEEPIVWYNDNENLGIRMFTIPIEDTFYGLLLIIMNINIYEWIKPNRIAS